MEKTTKRSGMETLDMLIREIARTRKLLIMFDNMPEKEVDKIINDLCEEHFKRFNKMDKAEMLVDMFKFSMAVDPERTLSSLFSEGD